MYTLLTEFKPEINQVVKEEFEFQEDNVMQAELLGDYGIGPRDLLYLFTKRTGGIFKAERNQFSGQ